MAFDIDDIVLVKVAPLGAPGTGVTAGDWTSYKATVDALNARPNISTLETLTDVQVTSVADGQALQWVAASSKWKNIANPQAIAYVKNGDTNVILTSADRLNFDPGAFLVGAATHPTQADVSLIFGTTAGTVRAGNQESNPAILNRWTFAATGVLSSGTRTLASNTSSALVSGVTYDWEAFFDVTGRNNVSSGTVILTITINGSSLTREQQTVGGVPHEMNIVHGGNGLVGTGAGITVSGTIAYSTGDATDVRDGWIKFNAWPRR